MADHFRTLRDSVESRQKIERSEFLGIAFPTQSEESFFADLAAIQKRHFDATHHCWAFRLFRDGRSRSSDAGEPGGSAGKPILNAIESADFYDCAVVVVRWYGGIKLGTGGLVRAYRSTAAQALLLAPIQERFVCTRLRVTAPFDALGTVYRLVAPPGVLLIEELFGETNDFIFAVRQSLVEAVSKDMTAKRLDHQQVEGEPVILP